MIAETIEHIADRVLAMGGPALLFENVIGSPMPVAVNLLGDGLRDRLDPRISRRM